MKCSRYIRRQTQLDDLFARLEGQVFHVTNLAYLTDILRAGCISPNVDRSLPSTFGYLTNGFFRNRGCVSLFDYRPEPTEEIRSFRFGCSPIQAALPGRGPAAILIFNHKISEHLIPWTRWQKEQAWGEMIVPHVETGFSGDLPTHFVDEIISLAIIEDPDSLASVLSRHFADGRSDLSPIQFAGAYDDGHAGTVVVLQDHEQRTPEGYDVDVKVTACTDPMTRTGVVSVPDQVWNAAGSSDEERGNTIGTALVSWLGQYPRWDFRLRVDIDARGDVCFMHN